MRHRISLLALAATVAIGCAGKSAPGARAPGQAPPPTTDFHEIPVVSAEGRTAALSTLLAGRPALVSFWAPWCEPCVRELPDLERLARAMSPCGAAVLGVAVGETPATVAAFTHARQLTYPQFTDERFQLADALGQSRVPTTVVFDRAARVVFVGEGLDQRAVAALQATVRTPKTTGCPH